MKAVISSDFTDIYLFNVPIVAWAWKQLGVEVIWFQTSLQDQHFATAEEQVKAIKKLDLISLTRLLQKIDIQRHFINCPPEKAATYAQNSRLYGACVEDNPDEILVVSDCDMLVFKSIMSYLTANNSFSVLGKDLVPEGQLPMCYLWGSQAQWQNIMEIGNNGYQDCLDAALAHENCENMRGNLWGRDQETIFNQVAKTDLQVRYYDRARPGTQFATNRLDRDDSFILDRLSPDIVDYHMHRPLWEPKNFEILLTILKYFWPNEDFQWVIDYCEAYKKLL
jgi:hypothetical protein